MSTKFCNNYHLLFIVILVMRDIKQIYHAFFSSYQLNLWVFGCLHIYYFLRGCAPQKIVNMQATSEPIDSTRISQAWYICLLSAFQFSTYGSVHEVRTKNVTSVENRKHENAWIVVGFSTSKDAFYRNLIRTHVLKGKRVSAHACQKLVICQCV